MSNLDDFFKKRDKKKKPTKSKFPTLDTDELAKNLEATAIKNEDDPDFQESGERITYTTPNENVDEEWKPFDSDENKDYTGLRINIQNWKDEDENYENTGAADENERKTACPWGAPSSAQNKSDDIINEQSSKQPALNDSTNQKTIASLVADSNCSSKSVTESESEANKTTAATSEATNEPAKNSTGGAYVPPALRRQQTNQESQKTSEITTNAPAKYIPPSMRNKTSQDSGLPMSTVSTSRRPNKSQPNINDTLEFPTLDASGPETMNTNENSANDKFDFPKKTANIEPKSGNDMINLKNKFTALSSNN